MTKSSNIQLDNLEIYKKIVEYMTDSLWIGNENGETIFVNNIFCDILGYKIEEVIGKNFNIFFESNNIAEIKSNNTNHKDLERLKYETNIISVTGKKIPVLCGGTIVGDGGLVLMMTDLRELKSLKEAEENLIKLNDTKDEFISIVGHELRTPLTSIRGYLSMILEGDMGEINQKIRKSLNHSYDSSIRLIKLVNDVLSIGKIESGKMEYNIKHIKIIDILKSTYNDIHLEMDNKGLKFLVDIDENLKETEINTDKDRLKQILLNLLTNSLKFTDSGGKIILKASKIKGKDLVRFEVIDNGVGIPLNKIDFLFKKFSQIESSLQRQNTSGLGLGLTLCKKIIEDFGSEIKINTELGKGSTFYFDLKL